MSDFYIKIRGENKAEAWVEDYESVICTARLMTQGLEMCFIDTIETKPQYRRKGHAIFLIKELQKIFKKVAPICVEPQAKEFWNKLGMEDALGEEDEA